MRKIFTLGLLETLIFTAAVWLISAWLNDLSYIVLWSLVGWTQLLRTRRSTALGLRLFSPVFLGIGWLIHEGMMICGSPAKRWFQRGDSDVDPDAETIWELLAQAFSHIMSSGVILSPFFGTMYGLLFTPIFIGLILCLSVLVGSAIVIRIVTTFWTTCRHPVLALRAIAYNWRRVACRVELFDGVEFIPRHRLLMKIRSEMSGRWMKDYSGIRFFQKVPVSKGETNSFLTGMRFSARDLKEVRWLKTIGIAAGIGVMAWFTNLTLLQPPLSDQVRREAIELQLRRTRIEGKQAALMQIKQKHSSEKDEAFASTLNKFEADLENKEHALAKEELAFASKYRGRLNRRSRFLDFWHPQKFLDNLAFLANADTRETPFWKKTVGCVGFVAAFCLFHGVFFLIWALLILSALSTPLRLVLFLPSLSYRISLKASAVTYAPLFFIGEAPFVKSLDTKQTFEREQKAAWPAVQRFFSKLSAAGLLLSVILAVSWSSIVHQLPAALTKLLKPWCIYLYPSHIAAGLIALATFVIWYVTRDSLWRLESGKLQSLETPGKYVLTLQRLRSMLSLYTLIWSIHAAATIVWPAIKHIDVPMLRWVFMPWNT